MMNYKNFDIDKAKKLSLVYKQKRHYAKEKLVNNLISWQYFFGNITIVGIAISLSHHYSRKTVETVLNDLDYKLLSYSTPKRRDLFGSLYGKYTNFSFAPNDSESTEGN